MKFQGAGADRQFAPLQEFGPLVWANPGALDPDEELVGLLWMAEDAAAAWFWRGSTA